MAEEKKDISVLLDEKRVFKPNEDFVKQTNVKQWMDAHGISELDELLEKSQDIEWFWGEMAKELLEFYEPYDKVLEWDAPWAKWFVGGSYNIVHDSLDRHVKTAAKDKVAYIFEGEPGDIKKWTYGELHAEVNRLANAMKKLGVKKGDRVGIYMPMLVELPIAMLACAKIGAIHSVVFSGFSPMAFADRLHDCEAKMAITCDHFYRRGTKVALKAQTDEALDNAPTVEHCIVYRRTGDEVPWKEGRDHWWHEICEAESDQCETEKLDANDLLYILYTSGTTGKPKGAMITHGNLIYNIHNTIIAHSFRHEDVHLLVVPLFHCTGLNSIITTSAYLGGTVVIAPSPDVVQLVAMIERHRVSTFLGVPTLLYFVCAMKDLAKHDTTSLRVIGYSGSPMPPATIRKLRDNFSKALLHNLSLIHI